MNEKFNKNAKVEQLTKMFLSCEEEKGLIVKDPLADMLTMMRRWTLLILEVKGQGHNGHICK